MTETERAEGLGTFGQGVVIVAVFTIVLTGMLAMAGREAALGELASDSTAAGTSPSPRGEATPLPAPDAAGPDTYTVQPGDSLFSVAADLGVTPDELIHWNKETYPTLESGPALTPGWVLATDGPPLPTPAPEVTPEPTIPAPQIAGGVELPVFGPAAFPASGSVTVGYYTVTGSTIVEISRSIAESGPYTQWIGERATAAVDVSASFDFRFDQDLGSCQVVAFDETPVDVTYHVILPNWVPPVNPDPSAVEWWIEDINASVVHEAHHIELYESFVPQMNAAVLNGTCDSAEAELNRLWEEASRANCIFDLEEYGYAAGLTLEDCDGQ